MNRPLRTRMMGGVGGAGETPASTRLDPRLPDFRVTLTMKNC
jgi:hypothetical protein